MTDRPLLPPGPPFRGIDWSDDLERADLARLALGRGLLRVEFWLVHRSSVEPLDLARMLNIHRTLFGEVWPEFAGRIRGPEPGQIATNVSFGNYRGVRFEDVPEVCARLSHDTQRLIAELDDLRRRESDPFMVEQVLRVAAYVHCSLVRIYPFVNGNGRTARACVSFFAARYGFLPIPMDRPTGAYIEATRTFLQLGVVDHFVDFLRPLLRPR